jgi:group I intron endonuclease
VNGKKYVGKWHLPTPKKRFALHKSSARRGSKTILHQAFRKHGEENFKCELLCTCPLEACDALEAYFAEQYGCYCWDPEPGYNMVWCGAREMSWLGVKHTSEARNNMRNAKLGVALSEEHRNSMRVAQNRPEVVELKRSKALGRVNTPEQIEKHRQAFLKFWADPVNRARMIQARATKMAQRTATQPASEQSA